MTTRDRRTSFPYLWRVKAQKIHPPEMLIRHSKSVAHSPKKIAYDAPETPESNNMGLTNAGNTVTIKMSTQAMVPNIGSLAPVAT